MLLNITYIASLLTLVYSWEILLTFFYIVRLQLKLFNESKIFDRYNLTLLFVMSEEQLKSYATFSLHRISNFRSFLFWKLTRILSIALVFHRIWPGIPTKQEQ